MLVSSMTNAASVVLVVGIDGLNATIIDPEIADRTDQNTVEERR